MDFRVRFDFLFPVGASTRGSWSVFGIERGFTHAPREGTNRCRGRDVSSVDTKLAAASEPTTKIRLLGPSGKAFDGKESMRKSRGESSYVVTIRFR